MTQETPQRMFFGPNWLINQTICSVDEVIKMSINDFNNNAKKDGSDNQNCFLIKFNISANKTLPDKSIFVIWTNFSSL